MVRKIKVPFTGKSSSQPRILGKQHQRARTLQPLESPTNKYSVSPEYNNNTTPSVVSTNSESSGTGNEVTVDWATATPVAPENMMVEAEPLKKKRTRSFRDRVFRARRSFTIKADNKRDFSFIESPIRSPTPIHIPMAGDDTTSTSPEEHTDTLNVRTLSLKKLAPPKPDGHYSLLDDDESSAFYKTQDRYLAAADNQEEEDEENTAATSESKDAFSIPLSYFLKKKSSWGVPAKTETSQSEQDSQQFVLQERHWGEKLRPSSRDGSSASWVPTDEERYKISQGFVSEKDQAETDTEDDDSSGVLSFATGSESTATGLSTFVTRNTGATGETEETEETNDTTSAFTGHYTDSRYDSTSGSESISTNKSVVTGTTGDTSMFSLEIDDDSESETSSYHPRRRRPRGRLSSTKRQKRRVIKSDKSIFVEVFSDLRLLCETMADEENGLRPTCIACA